MSQLAPPHRRRQIFPAPDAPFVLLLSRASCASPAGVTASFRTGPNPATAVQAIAALEDLLAARIGTAG